MEFLKTYFAAEKSESLIFIMVGLLAISFSTYAVWKWGDSFYKGFALPVIVIGLIQIIVGSTVYFRTDRQVSQLIKVYRKSPAEFKTTELPRMTVVMKNFSLYKKIEIAFIVIGLILILLISSSSREFWIGIGAGMLLQGAFMLTADIFAERRGLQYKNEIRTSWMPDEQ